MKPPAGHFWALSSTRFLNSIKFWRTGVFFLRSKENVEIVHWHYLRDESLDTIKRQAKSEGGQILILPSAKAEEAGGLSVRTPDLFSQAKVQRKSRAVKRFMEFIGETGNNFEYLDE